MFKNFPDLIHVKKHTAFYWFFALIIFVPIAGITQSTPMNPTLSSQIKLKIKEATEKTHSISSDFIQEKEMLMLAEKLTSTGKFFFRRERMLRWEYIEPFSYIIVIKNDQFSTKDENKVSHLNISSNKVFLEINRIILGSIQGTLLNDEQNFRAILFDNPPFYIARLVPLNSKLKESIAEIIIYFNHADYSVDKVEMKEPGGDITKITFTRKLFNKPIADEKFVIQ